MTELKIRKWFLEMHPTVNPIPICIVPEPREELLGYVPLLKDSTYFFAAKNLVDEHNALVVAFEEYKKTHPEITDIYS